MSNDEQVLQRRIRVWLDQVSAAKLLEANKHNRPIAQARVNTYAEDIKAGRWRYNPADAAIGIDTNGNLLNGQHRCWAVIETGMSIEVDIVTGLDPALFEIMDSGRSRSAGDVISIGAPDTGKRVRWGALVAAIATWQTKHEEALAKVALGQEYRLGAHQPLKSVILETWKRHPNLEEHINTNSRLNPRGMTTPSIIGWVEYRLDVLDHDACEEFMRLFCTGENIGAGHPVFALRSALMGRMTGGRGDKGRDREIDIALIFAAWNAFIQDRPIKRIKWRPTMDAFPQPKAPKVPWASRGEEPAPDYEDLVKATVERTPPCTCLIDCRQDSLSGKPHQHVNTPCPRHHRRPFGMVTAFAETLS